MIQQILFFTLLGALLPKFLLHCRNLVIALKELSIRGDFRTTVEYLVTLLETETFQANSIGKLDSLAFNFMLIKLGIFFQSSLLHSYIQLLTSWYLSSLFSFLDLSDMKNQLCLAISVCYIQLFSYLHRVNQVRTYNLSHVSKPCIVYQSETRASTLI